MRRPGRPRKTDEPLPDSLFRRICEHCGETYDKPTTEGWPRWLTRRFCSPAHYHEFRSA